MNHVTNILQPVSQCSHHLFCCKLHEKIASFNRAFTCTVNSTGKIASFNRPFTCTGYCIYLASVGSLFMTNDHYGVNSIAYTYLFGGVDKGSSSVLFIHMSICRMGDYTLPNQKLST